MYGKLFSSMFDGTLVADGNWQALVTFQQLIILCDKSGVIDMTAEALSRRTSIPIDIINKGLLDLMKPDPGSRTPEEGGRRIVFLDDHRPWGWRIVNHGKYRNTQTAEERREYHRQYYKTNRAVDGFEKDEQNQQPTQNSTVESLSSTDLTDTDTDTDTVNPCASDLLNSTPTQHHSTPQAKAFQVFWDAYPKKKNKGDAERAWKAIKVNDILSVKIIAAIEAAKRSKDWKKEDGKFIPYPASWLRAKGWEDEQDQPKEKRFVI